MPTKCDYGYCAIHYACYYGDSASIKTLVKFGADLDVPNKQGLQAMHLAAKADLPFPITFLMKRGVDVDCKDNEGRTPLHLACEQGSDEAIYYLLAWTKDVSAQDNFGQTPLHHAVMNIYQYGHFRSLKEMLIKGASRELKDSQGKTPLDLIDANVPMFQRVELEAILGK